MSDISRRLSTPPDVSIILPVHNEEGHLHDEIARIKESMQESGYSFEIIVIDDGSTDASGELLRKIDDIRLITFAENQGAGTARRLGTRAAHGRVVVWTDVDMSYPNNEIPRLVKELEGYDHVVGARNTEKGTARFARGPAKWFIRRLASYLVRTPIPDLNSGYRAFRREVALQYLHLLPRGFSCVSTLTMTFLANGYSVKYFPIEYRERAGESKFRWWKDSKAYLTQVIRMILSYEPLRVFMPLGLLLLLLGLSKLVFDWATKDFRLATNTVLVLFAALQTLSIGFVADLVVRVTKPTERIDPEWMTTQSDHRS